MTLLTQQILDHRASCPICRDDAPEIEIAVGAIQTAVAEMFGLSVVELRGKQGTKAVAVPRQIAMYLTRLYTDASFLEIGREFGETPHTTVAHSIATVDKKRRTDPKLALAITKLLEVVSIRDR
jgi:chromosomal replication initiator protein